MPRRRRTKTRWKPEKAAMSSSAAVKSGIRLNRFLAMAGIGSRRGVEEIITAGRVRVNGQVVTHPAFRVHPDSDDVVVEGNPVQAAVIPTYIALNKPVGYITTAQDERGRDTVFKLVQTPVRVFPIGRLDRDSEGLLLFTNDGELANRLMHPRWKVEKTYLVLLNRQMDSRQEKAFVQGVRIGGGRPARGALRFPQPGDRKFCEVTLREGRNRQIRRMFAALGLRVVALKRIRIGPVALGNLAPGEWRYLTEKEIAALKQEVGLNHGNHQ